jgi:anti-sigma28 factor (negative regulator of flagellin synthesis)
MSWSPLRVKVAFPTKFLLILAVTFVRVPVIFSTGKTNRREMDMVDPVSFHPAGRVRAPVDVTKSNARSVSTGVPEESSTSPILPRLVSLAQDLTRQGPPINYARVSEILQAISESAYQIDAHAIAGTILSFGQCKDS